MWNVESSPDWEEILDNIDWQAGEDESKESPASVGFFPQKVTRNVRFMPETVDVLAQCPKCKTIETIQFVGDTLTQCRKFRQRDGSIYHDCGSDQPCRLHR